MFPVKYFDGIERFLFASSVFTALDSSTVELFLELDGLETECDGLKLLHECMKNIPVKTSCDKHECSRTIIERLSHQVNIKVSFWISFITSLTTSDQ